MFGEDINHAKIHSLRPVQRGIRVKQELRHDLDKFTQL